MTSLGDTQTSAATLRQAYLTLDRMQRKLDDCQRARSEPIAIVGLGCRFPGGAVDAGSFWDVCAAASTRSARFPRTGGTRTRSTTPTAAAGEDEHPLGRLPRSRRPVRLRLLRDLAARGPRHGPAAAAAAGGGLGGAGERGTGARRAWRGSRTGVFVGVYQLRLRHRDVRAGPRTSTAYAEHRQRAQRRRGPAVLPARPAGPEPGRRHGLLVVAGRRAPGVPEPARRRVRPGAWRRRQRDPVARCRCIAFSQCRRDAGARRAVQDLRRRGRRLRARRGLRHRRAQAARRRARATATRSWP